MSTLIMRVIIAGSRTIHNYQYVEEAVKESNFNITEVVSGGARGVDKLGEHFARVHGLPCKQFIPDWSVGPSAGPIRNEQMAKYADALILVWDGYSKGSANMLYNAKKWQKKVYEKVIPKITDKKISL